MNAFNDIISRLKGLGADFAGMEGELYRLRLEHHALTTERDALRVQVKELTRALGRSQGIIAKLSTNLDAGLRIVERHVHGPQPEPKVTPIPFEEWHNS